MDVTLRPKGARTRGGDAPALHVRAIPFPLLRRARGAAWAGLAAAALAACASAGTPAASRTRAELPPQTGAVVPGAPDSARGQSPSQLDPGAAHALAPADAKAVGTPTGILDQTRRLALGFGLSGRDPQGLARYVAALSDPASPTYHHFLTPTQFRDRFGAAPDTLAALQTWLRSGGLTVTGTNSAGTLTTAGGTAAQVERLLHVELRTYALGGRTYFAPSAAPQHPAGLPITGILGLTDLQRFATPHHQARGPQAHATTSTGLPTLGPLQAQPAATVPPEYPTAFVGEDLATLYDMPAENTGQGQTAAVIGWGSADPVIKDLRLAEANRGLPAIAVRVVDVGSPGDVFTGTSGKDEWDLDTQVVREVAPGAARLDLYMGPDDPTANSGTGNAGSIDLLTDTIARWVDDNVDRQANLSAGLCEESPVEHDLGLGFEDAVEQVLTQAVAQGQTLFTASGDNGSSCPHLVTVNTVVIAGDPRMEYPAASPHAVGVGGTDVVLSQREPPQRTVEYAAPYTGGGSSLFLPAPDYQRQLPAVAGHCAIGHDGSASETLAPCRGVPDVAAFAGEANGFWVYQYDDTGKESDGAFVGTSVASPVWTATWTRVQAASAGGTGFANPALYRLMPATLGATTPDFLDITTGSNGPYDALPGWDYVSGLGVPDLRRLMQDVDGRILPVGNPVPPPPPTPNPWCACPMPGGQWGYWLVASDGGIFSYGRAVFHGSTGNIHLNQPIVGMAATPGGGGYWLVASDGGIFAFGDAQFHGSTGNIHLNQPIVGMAATRDGGGYWLVASDGGIFAFGDAVFHGSTGNIHLNQPIVGMAATPGGGGYWLVARDGGIFAFGDAQFHGSTGNIHLNQPIVGMAATPDGGGYWLVASDGGIFAFGDAQFHGSTGNIHLNQPIVGMAATPDGGGYWLVASDGGIFNFGDAPFLGSAGGSRLARPVVGVEATG